ncbi:MAG: arsenate reductase family protein [Campylobacterales bacterium]
MIKVYGIPTCSTVRTARGFFKDNEIEVEFIDFKKTTVGCEKVDKWLKDIDISLLFNNRGKKYRDLKLKDLNLDDEGKREWLCQENMLFKRPIVVFDEKTIVGFDEEKYKELFIKEQN